MAAWPRSSPPSSRVSQNCPSRGVKPPGIAATGVDDTALPAPRQTCAANSCRPKSFRFLGDGRYRLSRRAHHRGDAAGRPLRRRRRRTPVELGISPPPRCSNAVHRPGSRRALRPTPEPDSRARSRDVAVLPRGRSIRLPLAQAVHTCRAAPFHSRPITSWTGVHPRRAKFTPCSPLESMCCSSWYRPTIFFCNSAAGYQLLVLPLG